MREEEPGAHEAQYSTPSPPPTEPMHFIVPMSHSFTVPSYDTCAAHDQPPSQRLAAAIVRRRAGARAQRPPSRARVIFTKMRCGISPSRFLIGKKKSGPLRKIGKGHEVRLVNESM